MSEKLPEGDSLDRPSSAEDFLASEYQMPDCGEDLKTRSLPCGLNLPELLARYDRESSSWRTSQRSVLGGWVEFSETWPRSGTIAFGIAYRLNPSAHRTSETDGFA